MKKDSTARGRHPAYLQAVSAILLLFSSSVVAHEAHKHAEDKSGNDKTGAVTQSTREVLPAIASDYERTIKPLFAAKCLPCHGQEASLPWYYRLPGAKRIIDADRAEARKHLNMTQGFPFQGHGSIQDDLAAIRKSVVYGTMPPLRYRLLHWGTALTEAEQTIVLLWTDRSMERLRSSIE